jgi:hypothetical protein
MTEKFNFEEGGRTYNVSVEGSEPTRADAWWWFDVSGDRYRYAPFRAEKGDTKTSVQSRIVAYYTARLERKAMIVPYRPFRSR